MGWQVRVLSCPQILTYNTECVNFEEREAGMEQKLTWFCRTLPSVIGEASDTVIEILAHLIVQNEGILIMGNHALIIESLRLRLQRPNTPESVSTLLDLVIQIQAKSE